VPLLLVVGLLVVLVAADGRHVGDASVHAGLDAAIAVDAVLAVRLLDYVDVVKRLRPR